MFSYRCTSLECSLHAQKQCQKTHFVATSTLTGFCKDALWSFSTCENKTFKKRHGWNNLYTEHLANTVSKLLLQCKVKVSNYFIVTICMHIDTISQIILAFWLVLFYELLEERQINDVIGILFWFFIKFVVLQCDSGRKHTCKLLYSCFHIPLICNNKLLLVTHNIFQNCSLFYCT